MAGPAQERVTIDTVTIDQLLLVSIKDGEDFIESLTVRQYRELLSFIDKELSNIGGRRAQLNNLKIAARRIVAGE